MMFLEASRAAHPSALLNRVVYDSAEPLVRKARFCPSLFNAPSFPLPPTPPFCPETAAVAGAP